MLSRVLAIALTLSLAANGSLFFAYRYARERAINERETAIAQAATDANTLLTASLSHQATAYQARLDELEQRRQQSDAVTQAALDRAEKADHNLRTFRGAAAAQAAKDPNYASWAITAVPAGVNDRLQELTK